MGECFERGSEILEAKLELDAILKVVEVIEEQEIEQESILKEKMQLEKEYEQEIEKVSKCLSDNNNIIRLEDLWYAVRYNTPKGEPLIGIFAIDSDDLCMFEVPSDRNGGLRKSEIDTLVPAMEDEATLAMYLNKVEKKAAAILLEIGVGQQELYGTMAVSGHACKRWVQRKLQIYNESKITRYLDKNSEKVKAVILSTLEESECVWVDQEEIEYWISQENMVFVVGNDTVITLYEKDFGFREEINRSIIENQLEVIRKEWKGLQVSEKDYLGSLDELNLECSQLDNEIEVLQDKIELLNKEKTIIKMKTETLADNWKGRKQSFNQEFSKLFSRHKSK